MSEIKPVYQLRYGTGDVEVTEEQYFRESYMRGTPRRMLYPAAAYEALQKENAELKAIISNLTKAYERESNDCLKALEERDYWYEKADSLADKISECFDVPIGEHSNVNCPIVESMKILSGEYVTKFCKESAAQAKRIQDLEGEDEISAAVIEKCCNLLAQIAITLKGETEELARHGYHDLPELVAVLHLENELNKVQMQEMLTAMRRAVLALAFAAESSAAMKDDYNALSAAIAKAVASKNGE